MSAAESYQIVRLDGQVLVHYSTSGRQTSSQWADRGSPDTVLFDDRGHAQWIAAKVAGAWVESTTQHDDTLVFCPACTHQFRAVPGDVQRELSKLRAELQELQCGNCKGTGLHGERETCMFCEGTGRAS